MKRKDNLVILVAMLSILFATTIAVASPFTFEVIQIWDFSPNYSLFGTAADLLITVDNSNSSEINQSYTWQQITNIVYKTIGGDFYLDAWRVDHLNEALPKSSNLFPKNCRATSSEFQSM